MADDQIIVDIKVDNKDIINAEKSIDNLTDSIEELGNRISDARKQNKEYKKQQKELNDEYSKGKISTEQYEKGINGLNSKIKVNNKLIAGTSAELSKQKRERTANIKLVNSEAGSRDRLRQEIAKLSKEYNKIDTSTRKGRKEARKLAKELKSLNEEMNEGSLKAGNFKDNIGNYPTLFQKATNKIKIFGKALKAIGKIGILAVISAIVAVFAALGKAFSKSANGSKVLTKVMALLEGLFSVLITIMNEFAGVILKVFEDPQTAVKELWATIKKGFLDRMKGAVELMGAFGAKMKAVFFGTAEESEAASKKINEALKKIAFGETEDGAQSFIDKIKKAAAEAENMAAKFLKLEMSQRAMRNQSRTLEKDIAVLSAEFEHLGEVAGDDTRNMDEMRQAAIDAGSAAAELAKKQEKLAQIRLNTINQEVAIRRSAGEDIQDLLDQQADAEVALTEARSTAAIAQQKILIEQRKIERDIFEQNLDILLDVGDKIKTEQEKAIANEDLSLTKRRQLLEASRAALSSNFSEIKKEYELYGITAEQINDVINSSDAKQTNEKLKALGLNEIAVNRLREIILERKQAELDFADISKDLSDEEIERKQTANEKIKELNEENAVSQIENAEELKNKLIELEKARLELLLADETLLAEEREALALESALKIQEIENTFTEEKKEKDAEDFEEKKELLIEQFEEINEIVAEFAGEESALFGRIGQGIATAFEDGKVSAENALAGIAIASQAVFSAIADRRAKDLTNLSEARQRELEIAGDSKEEQAKINEKFDKKEAAIKLKQFNSDKASAIVQIAIQSVLAGIKTAGNLGFPVAIPFIAAIAALGITSAAIVAAKKPPKFGGGVSDIVNIGDSHASGNDTDVWGFSRGQKQFFGKVEKGEAMPVIRKSAANDYLIAKMNGRFSGKGKTFQDGTADITDTQQTGNLNSEQFTNNLINAISDINIVAKIEDITKEAQNKIQIVDNSKV